MPRQMFRKSQVNEYVTDLLEAGGIRLKQGSGIVRLVIEETGETVGTGPNLATAALRALGSEEAAQDRAQLFFFAAALSFGPDYLFAAIDDLWGEEDPDDGEEEEEEEEEDEEEYEDDSDEVINFHRA